jgi:hypothetical protein
VLSAVLRLGERLRGDPRLKSLAAQGLYTSVIIELWPPLQPDFEDTLKLEQQMAKESVSYVKTFLQNFNELKVSEQKSI